MKIASRDAWRVNQSSAQEVEYLIREFSLSNQKRLEILFDYSKFVLEYEGWEDLNGRY